MQAARNKPSEQVGLLDRGRDSKGAKSMGGSKWISSVKGSGEYQNNGGHHLRREQEEPPKKTTPSPPASPSSDFGKLDSTEKLKGENISLKKHLAAIHKEIKQSLSPGKSLNVDLETSIIELTSSSNGEGADYSASPSSDEINSTNAELKRRLEHENRMLYKIIDKVKADLKKAGINDAALNESGNNSSADGGGYNAPFSITSSV